LGYGNRRIRGVYDSGITVVVLSLLIVFALLSFLQACSIVVAMAATKNIFIRIVVSLMPGLEQKIID
jgi:hypothetical protein